MSELKYYKLFHRTSALTSPEFISVVEFGTGDEVCLKSEADKVIADLEADYKEACDRLQTANLIKDEQLAATRRQKYKRCLDKAELWLERYENSTDKENAEVSYMRYEKWIKLAEKFKEAK